ncbi:MAG: hypothetical protein M1833_004412 [Piccolia ochrophora]|nr:MAG: hypothetical protein M1833_004412 [Piccolia ochrophora]
MPNLKQLTCGIEWTEVNTPLPEYATTYSDGFVQCYVPIGPAATAFAVHLSSTGYIAPGLAMYVYMDGVYQCNRNRVGLKLPSEATTRREMEINFRVRQKEEQGPAGVWKGNDWRFEQLNTSKSLTFSLVETFVDGAQVTGDAQTLKNVLPGNVDHIGTIEVVVVRYQADPILTTTSCKPEKASNNILSKRKHTTTIENKPGEPTLDVLNLGGLFDGGFSPKRVRGVFFFGHDGPWDNPGNIRQHDETQQWGWTMTGPSTGHYHPLDGSDIQRDGSKADQSPKKEPPPDWARRKSRDESCTWEETSSQSPPSSLSSPPKWSALPDLPTVNVSREYVPTSRGAPRMPTSAPNSPTILIQIGTGTYEPQTNQNQHKTEARNSPRWHQRALGGWDGQDNRETSSDAHGPSSTAENGGWGGRVDQSNSSPWGLPPGGSNVRSGDQKSHRSPSVVSHQSHRSRHSQAQWNNDTAQQSSQWGAASNKGGDDWDTGNASGQQWGTGNAVGQNGNDQWGSGGATGKTNNDQQWGGGSATGQNHNDHQWGSGSAAGQNWDKKSASGNDGGWSTGSNDQGKQEWGFGGNAGGGSQWPSRTGQGNQRPSSQAGADEKSGGEAWANDSHEQQNAKQDWTGNSHSKSDNQRPSSVADNTAWGLNIEKSSQVGGNDNGNFGSANGGDDHTTWGLGNDTAKDTFEQTTKDDNNWHGQSSEPLQKSTSVSHGAHHPDTLYEKLTTIHNQGESRPDFTHHTKVSDFTKVKPYWKRWSQLGTIAAGKGTKKDERAYIADEPPLYVIPEETAMASKTSHQVQVGKTARYLEPTTIKPIYLDDMDAPYAVFVFKYRSRECLEKLLNISIDEDLGARKQRLKSMSKDEIIEEMLKHKTAVV